jgi:hypothetical protein
VFPEKFAFGSQEDLGNYKNNVENKEQIDLNPNISNDNKDLPVNTESNQNLKIINVSGKKKIILNKERKSSELKIIKRDK